MNGIDEIHCYHKFPRLLGGYGAYTSLIVLHKNVHSLIHAKDKLTIQKYVNDLELYKN